MAPQKANGSANKGATSFSTNLIAGGGAGMMEALVCHPLDTIKVRMQLSKKKRAPGAKARGFLTTGREIVKRETWLALYKGLGAVTVGIVPKMAIRFSSYQWYKKVMTDENGRVFGGSSFIPGLLSGVTEAICVVTPMEVVKIRLQSQYHSMADPLDIPKYRNAAHALYMVVREEGVRALYRGVSLTALRQGTNQAVNFTAYEYLKSLLRAHQPQYDATELPMYQTAAMGCISGAMGPLTNAPIDTIKTRLQKQGFSRADRNAPSALARMRTIAADMFKQEGFKAFYKGITPRIIRVAPGQAVTFTVYENLKALLEKSDWSFVGGKYEE